MEKKPQTWELLLVKVVQQVVTVPIVQPVITASTVLETTRTALCATIVQKDGTKMQKDRGVVCPACQAHTHQKRD